MRRQTGFTLIELMVVVAIIAIIAAIAIPAYNEQVRKSRRSEAVNGIGDLQLRQERWRAENPAYATVAQLGTLPASTYYTFATTTPGGTCTDGVTACTAGNCFALTATTAGAQTADNGKCATMTITSRCGQVVKSSTPNNTICWSR